MYHTTFFPNNNSAVLFMRKDKGVNMRDFLDIIPLNKLVIETDAPYLGFR